MRKLLLILSFFTLGALPVMAAGEGAAPEWVLFLGRFHPLMLHLPIGFVAVALAMEGYVWKTKRSDFDAALSLSWLLGAASATLATVLGLMLAKGGGYNEASLSQHKWLGIAFTFALWLIYLIKHPPKALQSVPLQKAALPLFVLAGGLMMGTGHLGGNLTHGSSYLTYYLPSPLRSLAGLPPREEDTRIVLEDPMEALVYEDVIQPLLTQRCTSCHRPDKKKGRLLLTSVELMKEGGKNGPALVAGDPAASLMLERIHLPEDDEHHMPPEGKTPLTEGQVKLLSWWIEQGAPVGQQVASLSPTPAILEVLEGFASGEDEAPSKPLDKVYQLAAQPAPPEALQRLRALGVVALELAEDNALLQVNFVTVDSLTKAHMDALQAVAPQITWLNLGRTSFSDEQASLLAQCTKLTRLHLEQTRITDASLQALGSLEHLEYLNLYGTQVSDAGLGSLSGLSHLRSLYLWQTPTTPKGRQALQRALPKLVIHAGMEGHQLPEGMEPPVPSISTEQAVFLDRTEVSLSYNFEGFRLFYTLDGSLPDTTATEYRQPISMDRSAQLQVIAYHPRHGRSPVARRQFTRITHEVSDLQVSPDPNPKYTAQGKLSLLDRQEGSTRHNDGQWLGYEGRNLTALLDLGEPKTLDAIGVGCLQSTQTWIFFPKTISVHVSEDGTHFTEVRRRSLPVPTAHEPARRRTFDVSFPPQTVRYLKVEVENLGKVPAWHDGAGGKAWVFVDEIVLP